MRKLMLIFLFVICLYKNGYSDTYMPIDIQYSDSEYSKFKMPKIHNVKSTLQVNNNKWLVDYSTIRDVESESTAYMNSALILYNIIISTPETKDFLKINKDEEFVWLCFFCKMTLDGWVCDNNEDIDIKNKICSHLNSIISKYESERLIEITRWTVENKSILKSWYYGNRVYGDPYLMDGDAYNTFFANTIYKLLDYIGNSSEAIQIAMKARFPKYDDSESVISFIERTLDFRAIEINLKYGKAEDTIKIIEEQFNPNDKEHLFNNLWIIDTLIKYGYTDTAKKLVLIGNNTAPSILLDIALDTYDTLSYTKMIEMRPLLNIIQKFVFE